MKRVLALVALLLMTLLLSCGSRVTESTVSNDTGNVATGVPADLQKLLEQYMPAEDGYVDRVPAVHPFDTSILRDTSLDVYAAVFFWGQIPNTTSPFARPTDWSGNLSMNVPEKINVVHTISFEAGEDWLLPSPRPATVVWVSKTAADFDGIGLLIFVKRGLATLVVPQLTFDTKPFFLQLEVDKLVSFSALYQVDSNNVLAVCARKLSRNRCPHGSLAGFWIREDNTHMSGRLTGKWLSEDGKAIGYFEGKFGIAATDPRGTFSGTRTDLHGKLTGYIKGTWSYDDYAMCPTCGTRFGTFVGVFTDTSGTVLGKLGGKFGDLNAPTILPSMILPLAGRWQTYCPSAGDPTLNANAD